MNNYLVSYSIVKNTHKHNKILSSMEVAAWTKRQARLFVAMHVLQANSDLCSYKVNKVARLKIKPTLTQSVILFIKWLVKLFKKSIVWFVARIVGLVRRRRDKVVKDE